MSIFLWARYPCSPYRGTQPIRKHPPPAGVRLANRAALRDTPEAQSDSGSGRHSGGGGDTWWCLLRGRAQCHLPPPVFLLFSPGIGIDLVSEAHLQACGSKATQRARPTEPPFPQGAL